MDSFAARGARGAGAAASRSNVPLLPPSLRTSATSKVIERSTAFSMSYKVSAATLTAVSASISTPVGPWQRTRLRSVTDRASSVACSSTFESARG